MNTRTSERRLIYGVKKLLFVDGEWREASGDDTMVVEDPSTSEALCEVADARPEDALAALGTASEAQAGWMEHPPRERRELLRRAFEKIVRRTNELALLKTLEMGKNLLQPYCNRAGTDRYATDNRMLRNCRKPHK